MSYAIPLTGAPGQAPNARAFIAPTTAPCGHAIFDVDGSKGSVFSNITRGEAAAIVAALTEIFNLPRPVDNYLVDVYWWSDGPDEQSLKGWHASSATSFDEAAQARIDVLANPHEYSRIVVHNNGIEKSYKIAVSTILEPE